jgi:hypothetical protein
MTLTRDPCSIRDKCWIWVISRAKLEQQLEGKWNKRKSCFNNARIQSMLSCWWKGPKRVRNWSWRQSNVLEHYQDRIDPKEQESNMGSNGGRGSRQNLWQVFSDHSHFLHETKQAKKWRVEEGPVQVSNESGVRWGSAGVAWWPGSMQGPCELGVRDLMREEWAQLMLLLNLILKVKGYGN